MSIEKTNTVVVGAGQAGLAISEHLGRHKVPHLVLERHRIAERWRSERWDSLVANGPAWHDRFPGMTFPDADPDSFVPKDKVADYFAAYARKIGAPVRCGVDVEACRRLAGGQGFALKTSEGIIHARNVVAATGPFQVPLIPALMPENADPKQIHSSAYRNPNDLPEGAVLVVGAGSSGSQIAEELLRAGRRVYLSIGPHERPPRRYRGRDLSWWMGVLGKWDAEAPALDAEHVTIAVSGAGGGRTVDFRRLAASGMVLLGKTEGIRRDTLIIADDLARNIARADAKYLALLDEADDYVVRSGIDLPDDPEAKTLGPDPDCVTDPIRELDLLVAGIATVIWATGFSPDYSWLELDIFDANGRPKQSRGVAVEPGIYFLGLPWQMSRGSSFIWGVWQDANYVADRITTRNRYLAQIAPDPQFTASV